MKNTTTPATNESETITADEALAQILEALDAELWLNNADYRRSNTSADRDYYSGKINATYDVLARTRQIISKVH